MNNNYSDDMIKKCSDIINRNIKYNTNDKKYNIKLYDKEKAKRTYEKFGFYDSDYHQFIKYLIINNSLEKIRKYWFDDASYLSAGTNGVVLENSNFIFKYEKSKDIKSVYVEAAIGFILNELKNYLPNFIYTYSVIKCSEPIIWDKKLSSWCSITDSKNGDQYIITENIYNSKHISKIKNMTISKFLEIYLQLINALYLAYKKFDYTHYDLHSGNILIYELDDYNSIPNYLEENTYIISKYIVYIIDYGYSFCVDPITKSKITSSTSSDAKSFFIYPNKSHPGHDLYKILLYSFNEIYNTNKNIYNDMNILYKYFDGHNNDILKRIEYWINNEGNDFFQKEFFKFDHIDLYNYIKKNFNTTSIISKNPTNTVLTGVFNLKYDYDTLLKKDNESKNYCSAIDHFSKNFESYEHNESNMHLINKINDLMYIYEDINQNQYEIYTCQYNNTFTNMLKKHMIKTDYCNKLSLDEIYKLKNDLENMKKNKYKYEKSQYEDKKEDINYKLDYYESFTNTYPYYVKTMNDILKKLGNKF